MPRAGSKYLAVKRPAPLATGWRRQTLLPAAQTPDSQQAIQTVLERRLGEPRWKQKGGSFVTPVPDSATALEILNELDGKVSDFQVTQGSMEDVFLHFTENGGVA